MEAPYPEYYPVIIMYDEDLGWLVEDLNNGEYEIQNFDWGEKVRDPDFNLAAELAKNRDTYIRYYSENGIFNIKLKL